MSGLSRLITDRCRPGKSTFASILLDSEPGLEGHIKDSRLVHQVEYIIDRASELVVGDVESKQAPEGFSCCTNRVDNLGLSEIWRVDRTTVVARLEASLTRLV
jgi:hypothetical protein